MSIDSLYNNNFKDEEHKMNITNEVREKSNN